MDTEIENLCIPLAAIRRGGAKPREISLITSLKDLQIGLSKINEGKVEVALELTPDGNKINVQGLLRAEWTAECRRCLEPVQGELKLNVNENFVEELKTFDEKGKGKGQLNEMTWGAETSTATSGTPAGEMENGSVDVCC